MRNYIKSEVYRIIHRRYYQLTILIFTLLSVIGNLALKFWGTRITSNPFWVSMDVLIITMAALPFILIIFLDITLGDEIKHKTINNAIANGISRPGIILSKIITTTIFYILFSIVVLGIHIIMSIVLFGENEEGYRFIIQYLIAYLSAIPLWMGLTAFFTIFFIAVQNQLIASAIIIILIFVIPVITRRIYISPIIYQLHPTFPIIRLITLLEMRNISSLDWFTVIFGLVQLFISASIAISVFKKKDF